MMMMKVDDDGGDGDNDGERLWWWLLSSDENWWWWMVMVTMMVNVCDDNCYLVMKVILVKRSDNLFLSTEISNLFLISVCKAY